MKNNLRVLHNVYAEIDLKALVDNLNEIKRIIPQRTRVMAVVKANGYGHGAVEVAKHLSLEGIDYLGVANFPEALELREAGISVPILILSEIPLDVVPYAVAYRLTQTVYTLELARELSRAAGKNNAPVRVHVKIDTGMGRVGVPLAEALAFVREVKNLPHLVLEGVFTHFAKADEKHSGDTMKQLRAFQDLLDELKKEGINIPLVHAANSGGVLYFPPTHLDLVRVGLSLYGLYPSKQRAGVKLHPVLSVKSRVAHVRDMQKGNTLGYGGTHVLAKDSAIAVIPIGYADGLSRSLSNRGSVLIQGKRYPIVGRVSMDLTLVDLGKNSKVRRGDEVVVIGRQGSEEITADELAEVEGTISYEIACRIGRRVPRFYI